MVKPSGKFLLVVAAVAVFAVLVCIAVAGLGAFVSPRDERGEPILLRPSVRRALEYERAEAELRGRLAVVRVAVRYALDSKQSLLARSNRLESALQLVMDIHAAAERLRPPLAYQSRRAALLEAVQAHGDLIRLAVEWLNEPSAENLRAVAEALCRLEADAPECAILTPAPTPTPWLATPTPVPGG